MIKNLTISNFQSHKNTSLELDKGVNCIIGSSDVGKSAILKAIYWLIYNRPQGFSFASHWIVEEEKLVGDICVQIDNIIRKRSKDENCYKIVGSQSDLITLEALRGDTPQEIGSALNITDVNIQKQLDAPFLLSESAGEVARFFNKIVNLDDIDSVLKNADSKKRQNSSDIKNIESEIDKLSTELLDYDWIEQAVTLVKRLEVLQTNKDDSEKLITVIEDDMMGISFSEGILNKSKNIKEVEELLKELESLCLSVKEKVIEVNIFGKSYTDYIYYTAKLEQTADVKKAEDIVNELSDKLNNLYQLDDLHFTFTNQLQKVKTNTEQMGMYTTEIEMLENQLPETCPVCNGTGRLK